ncbi:Putative deoxyribonuclease YjjV [Methylophaga frappieri]|uniref:Putative deoxyribonuclease YjjV n=1 Tax=Methylophaga frappieri (strain ATCC BAA-2434 / DSM 25690 / JAM7) TaxID=754477 RepID=I1YFX2_METFJ|nr:TatD family hydrolase [Methylophaga frappieri]AFJ01815.1 Putative deoxyribonuclease YjjV [Methylophaga frappieri]
MVPLIDSHCHLDFAAFDVDRKQLIEHCKALGITDIIVPGVTCETWPRMLKLCQEHDIMKPALGCHPMFMAAHPDDALTLLDTFIAQHRPVAIGEIGLDFYHSDTNKVAQLALFNGQLDLAVKYNLPVILHVRKAHDDVLKSLRSRPLLRGIVHAFSGSQQQAEAYAKQQFLLGIGGALTYPRAQRLQRLYRHLPLEQIVLETDAPDMPLCGYQGQRNSPVRLYEVLQKLTEIRDDSLSEIASQTSHNVQKLLNI